MQTRDSLKHPGKSTDLAAGSTSHHVTLLQEWARLAHCRGGFWPRVAWVSPGWGKSETRISEGLVKCTILTPLCTALLRSAVQQTSVPSGTAKQGEKDLTQHHQRWRGGSDTQWEGPRVTVFLGRRGWLQRAQHPHSHICLIPGDVLGLICTYSQGWSGNCKVKKEKKWYIYIYVCIINSSYVIYKVRWQA